MSEYQAEVVFRPGSDALAYLPEGPCAHGPGQVSWVAIQHGGDTEEGSVNILDLASGENRCHTLPGRPGFAFPTDNPSVFLTGFERKVGFFDVESADWVGTFGEVEGEEAEEVEALRAEAENARIVAKDLREKELKAGGVA